MRMGPRLRSLTGLVLLCCVAPEHHPGCCPGGPRKTKSSARLSGQAGAKQQTGIRKADPDALLRVAMHSGGDAKRGQALYRSAAAGCATCHKVHGQGGDAGPDLSQIGGKLDRAHLIESILNPSAEIPPGYHVTVIETSD